MPRSLFARWFVAALGVLVLGSSSPSRGGADAAISPELTAAERVTVQQLVDKALKERDLLKGKIYLTRIEVFRDSSGKTSGRNAVVTHYRYEGDLAILTSVDLGRKAVLKVETIPHFPTSLAPEELAQAEKLARAHPAVKQALARVRGPVEVDALMTFTAVKESPLHNHRVVRLFFRQGRTYVPGAPAVTVDLTSERVEPERIDQMHK